MLRCVWLSKAFPDSITEWRVRSGRKCRWRKTKISTVLHRQVQSLLQSAGLKVFLSAATHVRLLSQCWNWAERGEIFFLLIQFFLFLYHLQAVFYFESFCSYLYMVNIHPTMYCLLYSCIVGALFLGVMIILLSN